MTHKTFTTKQQNQTGQSNYSVNDTLSQSNLLIGRSKKRLRIIAIPPSERIGRGFFSIVDDKGVILADQLSDYSETDYYFECREEVSKDA